MQDGTLHSTAKTLTECYKACEFDYRCVAIDWLPDDRECRLNIDPDNKYHLGDVNWQNEGEHYDLVSRCNIAPGFDVYCLYLIMTSIHKDAEHLTQQ